MHKDISSIMDGWNYEPSRVTARWVEGAEGRTKIQLRLDLGLFQMETEGRPDGQKPRGYPTLIDYYTILEKTSRGQQIPKLDDPACAELQQEAVQFYYRYISLYALRDYDGVIRDTAHNLRILEFVERHAEDEDLAWEFLQFYPYIRMMNARATSEKFVENGREEFELAISAVEKALTDIQRFWDKYGEADVEIETEEEEILRELLEELRGRKPKSRSEVLREDLERAIAMENYEKAASLRDALCLVEKRERKQVKQDVPSGL